MSVCVLSAGHRLYSVLSTLMGKSNSGKVYELLLFQVIITLDLGKVKKKKKSFIRNSFALRWINNYPRPSGTNGPRGGSAMSISPGSGTTMHVRVHGHIGQPRCRARAARAARAQAQGTETLPQHGGFQEVRTHVLTSKSGSSSRSTAGKLFGTDGAKLLDHNERYPSMKMASNLEGKKNSSNQIFQEIQE